MVPPGRSLRTSPRGASAAALAALRSTGCDGNGATELWTIHLGEHAPSFNASWAPRVLDFLLAHPKP